MVSSYIMRTFLILVFLYSFPLPIFASVIINEIAWMGTPVQEVDPAQWWRYEWIELYNTGKKEVPLQQWSISLEREEVDFAIKLSGTIAPAGYFLIAASDKILGGGVRYQNLGAKFHNKGQRVTLKNAQGEIVEDLNAVSGWLGGDNGSKATMERRFPDRSVSDSKNWGTSMIAGGTPGSQNSIYGQEQKDEEESLAQNRVLPLVAKQKERQEGRSVLRILLWATGMAGISAVAGITLLQRFRFR